MHGLCQQALTDSCTTGSLITIEKFAVEQPAHCTPSAKPSS